METLRGRLLQPTRRSRPESLRNLLNLLECTGLSLTSIAGTQCEHLNMDPLRRSKTFSQLRLSSLQKGSRVLEWSKKSLNFKASKFQCATHFQRPLSLSLSLDPDISSRRVAFCRGLLSVGCCSLRKLVGNEAGFFGAFKSVHQNLVT